MSAMGCPDCGAESPPCPGTVRQVVGCYWWDSEVDTISEVTELYPDEIVVKNRNGEILFRWKQ